MRLRLADLPGTGGPPVPNGSVVPSVAGAPGILYTFGLAVDGARYEIRVARRGAARHVGLYRCDPGCEEHAVLAGSIGTTGAEVLVSVPLDVLAAGPGAALTELHATAGPGEVATGAAAVVDEIALPDAAVPSWGVAVGVAPAGTPEHEVALDQPAALADGRFEAPIETSDLAPGDYDVWARACLGEACHARVVAVDVRP